MRPRCHALLDHKPKRVLTCRLEHGHQGICKPGLWRSTSPAEERRFARIRAEAEGRVAR